MAIRRSGPGMTSCTLAASAGLRGVPLFFRWPAGTTALAEEVSDLLAPSEARIADRRGD
jgi:hypothetical protein